MDDQIEAAAKALADGMESRLRVQTAARGSRSLPGHMLCGTVAELARLLAHVDEGIESVKSWVSEQVADAYIEQWRHGGATGVDEWLLHAAVQKGVQGALDALTGGVHGEVKLVLMKVRILGILICPDPVTHAEVWNECCVPLLKGAARIAVKEELENLRDELEEATTHRTEFVRFQSWPVGPVPSGS